MLSSPSLSCHVLSSPFVLSNPVSSVGTSPVLPSVCPKLPMGNPKVLSSKSRSDRRFVRLLVHKMICFVAETYSHMVEGRLDISRLKSALFCLFSLFDVSWCKHFVSFILSSGFDSFPFKSLCSYAMPFPIGNHSVVSAQWKPLGKVGSFQVPSDLIDECVDFSCVPKPPKGVCVPKPCVANQALLEMCVDLSNLGVISCLDGLSCPPCPTMNLSLRPKPNNPSKYLLICDLRAMIQMQRCAPLKFTLPSLESLFALQGDISFCTIDIANAYHSCVLPESVASAFVFALFLPSGAVSTFRWNRLPFGWDRSPVIFSKILSSVLPSVVSSVGEFLIQQGWHSLMISFVLLLSLV